MARYGSSKKQQVKRHKVSRPVSKSFKKSPYKKSNAKIKNANLKF